MRMSSVASQFRQWTSQTLCARCPREAVGGIPSLPRCCGCRGGGYTSVEVCPRPTPTAATMGGPTEWILVYPPTLRSNVTACKSASTLFIFLFCLLSHLWCPGVREGSWACRNLGARPPPQTMPWPCPPQTMPRPCLQHVGKPRCCALRR